LHSSLSTHDLALAALFAALISVGALVSVPMFGPVPLTLQVLFVLLAGLALGARLGALSVVAYLVIGLVAPVYAQGASGLGALAGPAGGYLVGFVVAAYVVGALGECWELHSFWPLLASALAGLVPIYAIGASWLAWQLHTTKLGPIVWGGVVQFIPGDVAKAVLAALAARALVSLPLGLRALSRSR
jgi:biotin transport system substrate-specific component